MSSEKGAHSCQQDPGGRAAVSVISFPFSMEMASESKEANELNQCSRPATAGRKNSPVLGKGSLQAAGQSSQHGLGGVKGQQPMAPWSSPRHLRSLRTKPASSRQLSGSRLGWLAFQSCSTPELWHTRNRIKVTDVSSGEAFNTLGSCCFLLVLTCLSSRPPPELTT